MARKFLTSIDLAKNEIQNAVVQVLGSAPSSPVTGQFYYDSTTGSITWRNASAWVNPLARSNHTGSQTASTISDFDSRVRANRLDQMAAPAAAVPMNNQKIVGLADGVSASDAATFGQLQAILNGRQFKDGVRVATNASITLSGLQTIDGVAVAAGDRVLVKDQATASQNGIYVAASGAWTRSTDADNTSVDSEVKTGMSVFVSEGTNNADLIFSLTTNGAITIGTTALSFATTGRQTVFAQGTGISISGNIIAIDRSLVPIKASHTIGNGSSSSFNIQHPGPNIDLVVNVYDIATGSTVEADVSRSLYMGSVPQVTVSFSTPPEPSSLRVVVIG